MDDNEDVKYLFKNRIYSFIPRSKYKKFCQFHISDYACFVELKSQKVHIRIKTLSE